MEYLAEFLLLTSVRPLTTLFFLPPKELLMLSPIRSQILPYFMMFILSYIMTYLVQIVRVTRNCHNTQVARGLKQSLFVSLVTASSSVVGHTMSWVFPSLLLPFISLSILPMSTLMGESFYLALIGTLGYIISQLFFPICN
jgi:hypothetical protein